jgi:hypothetical protein
MISPQFWQTFVQLLSFNGYVLPEELHHYYSATQATERAQRS